MKLLASVLAILLTVPLTLFSQGDEKSVAAAQLLQAVEAKDHPVIEQLLKQGVDPNKAWTDPKKDYHKSVLHIAIDEGDHKTIKLLLDGGADVWAEGQNGWPAFFWASDEDKQDTLKFLVDYGIDINGANSDGETLLSYSFQRGSIAEVRFLLELGADPNLQDKDGKTAFMCLINSGTGGSKKSTKISTERLKLFIKHNANLNLQDKQGQTALMRALQNDFDTYEAKALLKVGADVRIRDHQGRDALMIALDNWRSRELTPGILEQNPDLTIVDQDGNTVLLVALKAGEAELAEKLIKAGAQMNIANKAGQTTLHLAASHYDLELIKQLLKQKADPHAVDEDGNNPIHYMCRFLSNARLDPEMVGEVFYTLKKTKINLKLPNSNGDTPLHRAAANNPLMVQLLLENGADVEALNLKGETPLTLALQAQRINSVIHLLKHGADANTQNKGGGTALHLALEKANPELVDLLMKAGANPNLTRKDGTLPLHLAVKAYQARLLLPETYSKLVTTMLEATRNPSLPDTDGITALMWLAASNRSDLLTKLIAKAANLDSQATDGRTAAMWAAVSGAEHSLATLKNAGANMAIKDKAGRSVEDWIQLGPTNSQSTPLLRKTKISNQKPESPADAVALGDKTYLKDWLAKNPDKIDGADTELPLLQFAAMHGRTSIVKMLLDAGANPKLQSESGTQALHWAVANGHVEVVKRLLETDTLVNALSSGFAANTLTLAIRNGHDDIYLMLIKKGANPRINSGLMLLSAMQTGSMEQLKMLLAHGADPLQNFDENSDTAISHAGQVGKPIFLEALLKKLPKKLTKARQKRFDRSLTKAMYNACLYGRGEMVRYLINSLDIDPNLKFSDNPDKGSEQDPDPFAEKDPFGSPENLNKYSPFSLMVAHNQPETVRFLLESGARMQGLTRNQDNPFIRALENNYSDMVDLLLEYKTPLELHAEYDGETPLMNVARLGNLAQAKRLIAAGAKVNTVSLLDESKDFNAKYFLASDGVTAFLMSCYGGQPGMAAYLIEQGADLKKMDGRGRGALHAVVTSKWTPPKKRLETLKWLLEQGLNANEPNAKNGDHPLDAAARNASTEIIKLLLDHGAEKNKSAHDIAVKAKRNEAILRLLK